MNREINKVEAEYFRLLRRWQWIDDEPGVTMDEVRASLARLSYLWDELHKAGKEIPYKLEA